MFPLPNLDERVLYARYWRQRLEKTNNDIDFPEKLCPSIAEITRDFSFAYMQEAFVAALLELARGEIDMASRIEAGTEGECGDKNSKEDPLDRYKLWIAMKHSVKILRRDLEEHDLTDRIGRLSTHAVSHADRRDKVSTDVERTPQAGSSSDGAFSSSSTGVAGLGTTLSARAFAGQSPRGKSSQNWHLASTNASYLRRGDDVRRKDAFNAEEGGSVSLANFWRSGRGTVNSRNARPDNSEPSTEEVARAGVTKNQLFADAAFEWL